MADELEVEMFLTNHVYLELIEDNQNRKKVKCKLTGHELPCCVSQLQTYIKGKKYQRLLKNINKTESSWNKYQEFLVPNEKSTKHDQLFCKLTKKSINNIPHHIEKHVNGRKFQKALAKYEKSLDDEESSGESNMWVPSDLDSDDAVDNRMTTDHDNESKNSFLEPEENYEERRNSSTDEKSVQDNSKDGRKHEKKKNSKLSARSQKRSSKKSSAEALSSPKKKRKAENTKQMLKHKRTLSKKSKQMKKKN